MKNKLNEEMLRLGKERSAIRELFEYGRQRAKEIGAENVFDFSLGNPSVPAPVSVTKEAERLLREVPAEQLHGYTSAAGAPEVRAAVAEYIGKTFSVPQKAEHIYMTCGAAASLTVLLGALCTPGDEIVVIAPYFPEYRVFIERAGGKVREVPAAEDFHLDLGALEEAIGAQTKAVLYNSPNNPTGAVYGEEELRGLARLLERKSRERGTPVYLIADEPYRELSYGAPVPYAMNLYDHAIVCYSFSKSLSLAGERIGYLAVSPRCADADALFAAVCGAGRALGYVCAPALFQRVIATNLGKASDVSVYRANRDLLCEEMRACGFSYVAPEGAFYLFVKSPEPDAKAFCERAKGHELLLVPSDSFGIGGYVRVSYCVPRQTIERALPAFAALAREYGL